MCFSSFRPLTLVSCASWADTQLFPPPRVAGRDGEDHAARPRSTFTYGNSVLFRGLISQTVLDVHSWGSAATVNSALNLTFSALPSRIPTEKKSNILGLARTPRYDVIAEIRLDRKLTQRPVRVRRNRLDFHADFDIWAKARPLNVTTRLNVCSETGLIHPANLQREIL
ncbi:hypothetical protein DFH07DRAFT_237278 [Mycena maculata]|uniref:Uncharacterized protein n=1 Tax=Mycena maculata TaxID=230809 RepID=A0AAD7JSI4_9AGAR|nr:hypothetical protein DFH07DRAFT_237278 [Mycena maculata]